MDFPSELLQPSIYRKGLSIGETRITQEIFEYTEQEIHYNAKLTSSEALEKLKYKVATGKKSVIEQFIAQSDDPSLLEYLEQADLWNVFIHYDMNCQSQLVVKFMQGQRLKQFKEFEFAVRLTMASRMNPDLKRKHLTSVLMLVGADIQAANPGREIYFDGIIRFLGGDKAVSFRQILDDPRLTTTARVAHASEYVIVDDSQTDSTDTKKAIANQIVAGRVLDVRKFEGCCTSSTDCAV